MRGAGDGWAINPSYKEPPTQANFINPNNKEQTMITDFVEITINLNGAVGFSAVVSSNLHCMPVAQTEKAVKVVADDGRFIWLPKKALIVSSLDDRLFKLARWFKPDARTWDVISHNRSISGVSSR